MSAEWKQRREGGGRFALRLLLTLGRWIGRAPARLLLYPITLYFLLRRHAERRDSRAYLSRVQGRPAGLWQVARHIHTFAATILDRPFLLSGNTRRFDIRVQGLEQLKAQLDGGRGVLLFGSHLGSFEVLRILAREQPRYRLRVLLDRQHGRALTELLDALAPDVAATVIDASQEGTTVVMAIKDAAESGAMVAMLVDRVQDRAMAVPVPFLGEEALFPTAPWLMASALKLPVMLAFGLYRGGNRYDLVFEPFSERIDIPRRERAAHLHALIAGYARRLEHHVHDAPYNWFNFYDFWKRDDAPPAPVDAAAGTAAAGTGGAGRG